MKNIAFVPVRGGSKSIPLKNVKEFCGKPLIFWILKELSITNKIDRIVVATDCNTIRSIVKSFDLPKVIVYDRLPINAEDTSSTESVMLEYLNLGILEDDNNFILVQATSPFTQSKDFDNAIKNFETGKYDSLISCAIFKRFIWDNNSVSINYDYTNRPRRQDFEGSLIENGAFYISKVGNIIDSKNRLSGKIGTYIMPEYTSIEIDEPDDWVIAEHLMKKHILKKQTSNHTKIKLFLTDVDGVLTDAGMYYSENGDELKKFNTRDGKGIELLRKAGIKTGIITSENTKIVKNRAKKLKMDYLYQGVRNKLQVAKEICTKEGIGLEQVAYIGDDINCLELLQKVGLAACPADADEEIRRIPNIIHLSKKGGNGVVRELIFKILKSSYAAKLSE